MIVIVDGAFAGSVNKVITDKTTPIMQMITNNDYSVSVDQISELYIVAEIASDVALESSSYLNMDYISAVTQYSINQSSNSSKIEKPINVDVSHLSRGVVTHTVKDGETIESIAAHYGNGLTSDQIRWSNNLKTTAIKPGDNLYISASIAGIVYTVKDGDTIDKLADKYGSSVDDIALFNDKDIDRNLSTGELIVIPNGVVPEKERPEYVAPPVRTYVATNLRYSGSNPMPWGWCTWYAWQWRHDNMPSNYWMPSGLGNARYWDNQLSGRYYIDKTPRYGDVFVSEQGYYGHVGIVTGVNADGSITFSDMNGVAGWGRIGSRTASYSEYRAWNFIHQQVGT